MTVLKGLEIKRSRPLKQLPLSPDAIEREYYLTVIRPFLDIYEQKVQDLLIDQLPAIVAEGKLLTQDEISLDDVDQKIGNIFALIEELLNKLVSSAALEKNVAEIGVKTAGHASLTVQKQIEAKVSANIGMLIGNIPGLQEKIKFFTRENIGLIKSIPKDNFDKIQEIVLRGVRTGANSKKIAKEIQERFKVSDNRARLISDDQIGKFHGELRRVRQKSLGITHYIWRTRTDVRVRPEHKAREGKKFSYKNPPPGGHPGQAVRCRCFEDPILPL